MSAPIDHVEIAVVEIPYRVPYRTATNITPKGRHVVLRVETADGTVGWGETGIISSGYPAQGDAPETIAAVLESYLAPMLLGRSAWEPLVTLSAVDGVIRGHLFAKAAVDHALLDLQGKLLGVSLAVQLGGQFHASYGVSRSLPLAEPQQVAARARDLRDEGYARLTLKGSGDVAMDVACFRAVREALGPEFELEIDPNGSYQANDAIRMIRALEDYGLLAVEQPTPGADVWALAQVRAAVQIPVIADESVFSETDLRHVISLGAADVICLKPFKSGGVLASRRLQHAAECSGLQVSTGSMHPFGIGTAALHHFASSIPVLATTGYGSPAERFVDDIVDEACYSFKEGVVTIGTDRPGLGVVVNEDKVRKYSSRRAVVSARR
ncbi:mandelate racemase/muconate lactonizing enzyme family protein [Symbioplanes lichenis]|uniref:mandelate racemase/muconate lactonizing enzyme family protein n=1 Tax=Symbioplanes lichenis TaxID=1629072 RepID=UPI00273941FF|nr:enolase C-terminal domain-like protein [Actinoplanes lichenis]